ncbi:hypothetical protein EMGR_000746 [Emarellia grisea]
MLSFSLPSFSFLPSWKRQTVFDIPPVRVHDVDTAHEKPARALKHLLKLNHANHAILYNERKFHNHAPHILSSAFLQGADADDLNRVYEAESKTLEPWIDSPGEISTYDWRDFLGRREYQRAFVDFFEDELVRHGYDWKKVVADYLFSGKEPLFSSLVADLGHPLIHLGYAFEMSSREVAMEALGLVATCYSDIHKYIDDSSYSRADSSYHSSSLFEILAKVRADKRFKGVFATPGDHNLETLFRHHEAALLDHWNAWKIEDPVPQFRESQQLAAAVLTATQADPTEKYDFFLVHILTTSHAVRILLPLIPARFQVPLVRQWWLMTLAVYIAQLRPEIDLGRIRNYDPQGRDWKWTAKQAVKSKHSTDAHYVKALRAMREAAATWGDSDGLYLKAAVKFAEEFDGWGGSPEKSETDVDASLYLHAELLPNIRHITFYISIPANLGSQNIQPLITLSESRRSVSVSLPAPFDHVADTIKLPARVNEASRRVLATSRQGDAATADNDSGVRRREFSFRMQIDEPDDSLPSKDPLIDDFVPWTAADMSPSTRLRCSGCENVILNNPRCADGSGDTSPAGWTWKDLPSGNWAEMMDFWHCHKPDPPEGHRHVEDPNAQTKGYGAANQVVATAGTVLVDVATFLVSEADCGGLKKVQQPTPEESAQKKEISLNCANCNASIGIEDAVAQGWRLFKTSLSASIHDPTTWETHPIETIVAAQLLELIERQSARRFVIHCGRPNGLLLWVFNPDFRYSSSSAEHTISSQRAMKVLFQEVGDVDTILNPARGSSLSLEEVRLPEYVYEAVERDLEARNEMLPASARAFREWKVGALHRSERM